MSAALRVDQCISVTDAARLAGVTDRHLRLLIEQGRLPAVKVGRAWLVSRKAVLAWRRHPTMGRPAEA